MDKEILKEVFKSKAFDENAIPRNYSRSCAFEFYYDDNYVDIRIFPSEKGIFEKEIEYYIQYETIKFSITKEEFDELFKSYKKRKDYLDKIEEEKERQTHLKNNNAILEMYQKIVSQKREVLIEKQDK